MSDKLHISIPTPCHENWQAMAPADRGRFCASCQKNVIDFTALSDREIVKAFKIKADLCGRFLNTQLERDLVIPKEKSSLWMAASAVVVALLTIGNSKIFAQTPVNTEQGEKKTEDIKDTSVAKRHIIRGIVLEENSLPISGAKIEILNSTNQTTTDSKGEFMLEVNLGDKMCITYMGVKKVITINNAVNYNITIIEPVMSTGIAIRKRTFFGRIFHSIGSIFR